jgi:alkylation response protein AidB-like acyl-CoA dehydrogenase
MLLQLSILLVLTAYCLYQRKTFEFGLTVVAVALLGLTIFEGFSLVPWLLVGITAVSYFMPDLRREYVSKPIFKMFKKLMPAMSETEKDALEAGDVWIDKDLFQGKPDWDSIIDIPKPQMTQEEIDFLNNETETLCEMLNEWEINQDMDMPEHVWKYIKEAGFLGIIIPKKYGGKEFSALAHSTIVNKISSRSCTAAVSVMVPNSLGPAELLMHYGTDAQKDRYLPGLASGKEIPCFALTGTANGSDAGAMTDFGIVKKGEFEGKEVLGIEVTWDKRYITLAPIATVLGLAFKLYDPDKLLGDKEDIGITCALIPTSHPGVNVGDRHLPMNLAFMNGPTHGDKVFIPMEWVVGGPEYAGKGWRMLVELLSIGRSISLPAMGVACGKVSYRYTGAYARIREQFNTAIANFEGIQEPLARIAGLTYRLEASRRMTSHAIDLGVKPSVISGIAKYHMTEMGRVVVNDSMDIHGGRAIIMGERNYMAVAHIANPVSITVEGANILTRNLMIFGQGAVRCHPWVFEEMMSVANPDQKAGLKQFDRAFFSHIGYSMSNFVRAFWLGLTGARFTSAPVSGETDVYYKQLTRMSSALAFVSDVAMLMIGGDLKRRERLSARLGDVLSHLYMSTAVLKFYEDEGRQSDDLPYVHWNLQNSLNSMQVAFKEFLENFTKNRFFNGLMYRLVFPWGDSYDKASDRLDAAVVEPMLSNTQMRERMTYATYVSRDPNDVTGRVENAFNKVLLAADSEYKLSRALKKGLVTRHRELADTLKEAQEAEIITSKDAELIKEAADARWDALKTDAYPPEWFERFQKASEHKAVA